LALLERIIAASSNEGDVVLDPFCGCGTAVHAAQKLNRQWIGIDITHLAISLIEKRLKDAFGAVASGSATVPVASAGVAPDESARANASGGDAERCGRDARAPQSKLEYVVHGTPKDLDAARDLATRDKYQFQWWAVSLVEAQPFQGRKKGADGGIDGLKFFGDYVIEDKKKTGKDDQVFKTCKIVVSVKGGGVKADDVRSLMAVREREGAEMALFISLEEPTRGMLGDAASAGFYESATGKKYPRVQLLTIGGLLSGQQRAEHPDQSPDLNFKKAKAESNAAQKNLI
jgi:site-specific DNA-methyltransferase (adenine-specific)